MKKLLFSLFLLLSTTAFAQNVNNSISIKILKYEEGFNYGYYEKMIFSINNSSDDNLMMLTLKMYDYNDNSIVYYSTDVAGSYLSPNSSAQYVYNNNSGKAIVKEKAWIIEFQYLNMTTGGEMVTKKVYKPQKSISTNTSLEDISDPAVTNSGKCGASLTWTYTEATKKLTIEGTGPMTNYNSFSSVPWYYYQNNIEKIIIGPGVTSIGKNAFYGLRGLTSVTIPNSVTSIGESAFYGCSGLTSVTIPNSVTSIGERAFYRCSGLTSINIPNSVTSIGSHAFSSCSGLTSVTIPNSVTSIGERAFYGCSGLKKVIIKDIAAWCGIKFGGYYSNPLYYAEHMYSDENTEITNLAIPNGVTSIGKYAFYRCKGLTSVIIPNSVTSIEMSTFRNCSGLTSVTIPNSVTSIGDYAFEYCSGLTSITIPNSVTSIGGSAFSRCSGLTSVTIGSGVTSIGGYAFDRVDIPTIISLIENPFAIIGKTLDFRTFSQNTFNNATLYVPKGTIDKYKATEGWTDFAHIEEGNPTGINVVENIKNHNITLYDLNGRKLSEKPSHKGIYINNGKKLVVK